MAWIAVAAVLAGGVGWLLLSKLGNDTGVADFRANQPTLSAREAGSDDPEQIASRLVDRWLKRFTTGEFGRPTRLRAYRVDRLDVRPASGERLVVSVRVSLQPTRWSLDNWLAGSGGTVREGWIHGKFLRFAVTKTPAGYRLRELGPGPL